MISKRIKVINEKCVGCRICQFTCSFIYYGNFNPSKARIKIFEIYSINPKIEFSNECVKCGQCVESCLYGALEFLEVNE